MQAHNLIPFPSAYEKLYTDYMAAHQATLEAWQEEIAAAERLHDSGTWKAFAPTWEIYCSKELGLMPYRASTYRVKRHNANFAETIMSIVANAAFSETDVRKVKARLSNLTDDRKLQAIVYAKAHEHTGSIVPSERELQIAYEEIVRARQQDILTIEGVDHDARDLVIDANIQQELYELGKRKTAHIEASQGIESKRLEISQNQAIKALFAALGMDVPQGHDFVLYWKESRK